MGLPDTLLSCFYQLIKIYWFVTWCNIGTFCNFSTINTVLKDMKVVISINIVRKCTLLDYDDFFIKCVR